MTHIILLARMFYISLLFISFFSFNSFIADLLFSVKMLSMILFVNVLLSCYYIYLDKNSIRKNELIVHSNIMFLHLYSVIFSLKPTFYGNIIMVVYLLINVIIVFYNWRISTQVK